MFGILGAPELGTGGDGVLSLLPGGMRLLTELGGLVGVP
jgi:hypothetical protein